MNHEGNNINKKNTGKGGGLFSWLETSFKLDKMFQEGVPIKYLPRILYVVLLIIFYIGNNHYAERMIREINKLRSEVEELRADYTTLKADYMYVSKQSEIAKKVKSLGLEESKIPPIKINYDKP